MSDRKSAWIAPEQPEWVQQLNREGDSLPLESVLPLTEQSLLEAASARTGLTDYGDDHWREGFRILCRALDEEAELTLMGRLMARDDLLCWLQARLDIRALVKQHPEILEQKIVAPMVIVGLPRSGTSILFELLSQDPDFRVPAMWEATFPCPPPEPRHYRDDPRIGRAQAMYSRWGRVVPAFNTMHEMGGRIPAECGLLMAPSFISDHICALHQTPSYDEFYATADMRQAYAWHKLMLQVLQWKYRKKHWLLKAPAHQNFLDILLATYPDARIVQTHRDPIKCMASATNLMGAIYTMRSRKAFDARAFDDFLMGEATARRLERVMQQRASGVVPAARIHDSRYQDLMESPMDCIAGIYRHFGMTLTASVQNAMKAYLASKPQGKFGRHDYQVGDEAAIASDRALFARYQRAYDVPDEV